MGGPLTGWTVVVTRAETTDGPLGRALAAEGARVLHVPTVSIGPPDDPTPLRAGVERLGDFDWLVLTSARAVDAVLSGGLRLPDHLRVAVVGNATAERARSAGLPVALVGSGEGGEALARDLVKQGIGPGTEVFFPASSRAGPGLVQALQSRGAKVEWVVAYETRTRVFDVSKHPEVTEADVVTFTSPSAVEGWLAGLEAGGGRVARGQSYVAIGATTAAAMEESGLEAVVASEPSFQGIAEATRLLALGTDTRMSRSRNER